MLKAPVDTSLVASACSAAPLSSDTKTRTLGSAVPVTVSAPLLERAGFSNTPPSLRLTSPPALMEVIDAVVVAGSGSVCQVTLSTVPERWG